MAHWVELAADVLGEGHERLLAPRQVVGRGVVEEPFAQNAITLVLGRLAGPKVRFEIAQVVVHQGAFSAS